MILIGYPRNLARGGGLARALALLACAVVLVFAARATAQSDPELHARADRPEVEVGQPFLVSLEVSVDGSAGQPESPLLPVPAGVSASAPSISTRSEISIVNGRISRRTGFTISWQLQAAREGTYRLGPPSIGQGGQRRSANAVTVTVRPAGSLGGSARPGSGRQANPFDPFGMFPHLRGLFDAQEPAAPQVNTDPELTVESPPDPNLFLRSVASTREAVVGEQVTVTIYAYIREAVLASGRDATPTDRHEPAAPDFLSRDLMTANNQPEAKRVSIGGSTWYVTQVYRTALFPLTAGDLTIGAMRQSYPGLGHARAGGGPVARESEPLFVHVTEPPRRGRPAGYQIGDVGAFSLTTTVEPRSVDVGGSVAITATLSGLGNPPASVRVPTQASVEWLDPDTRESIDLDGDKIRSTRTLTYVVRAKAVGDLDLGALTLPFYNPQKRAYEIARASLGTLSVRPSKGGPTAADTALPLEQDPFRALAPPRAKLGAAAAARAPLTDSPAYWALLFGAPFAVLSGLGAVRLGRRLAGSLAKRRASPQRSIDEAIASARRAGEAGDTSAVSAGVDRALHLGIEQATGLRARGLLIEELPRALVDRGVGAELARELGTLLGDLDRARFDPAARALLGDVLERAVRALGLLRKHEKPAGTGKTAGRAAVLLLVLVLPSIARAEAEAPPTFEQTVGELTRGEIDQAIDSFEALADQGLVHPDASFDRGLAYAARVRAGAERPGDLGKAAAAFEEAILLRPGDRDAESALVVVREQVARRRARRGASADVEARPTLDRALVGVASEQTWAWLALFASAVLSLSLALRAWSGADDHRTSGAAAAHLAGAVGAPLGALLLAVFAVLGWGARHVRTTTHPGVVVSQDVHLTDERGTGNPGFSVPEAARVELGEQRGATVQIRWGSHTGWIPVGTVRRLAAP